MEKFTSVPESKLDKYSRVSIFSLFPLAQLRPPYSLAWATQVASIPLFLSLNPFQSILQTVVSRNANFGSLLSSR